MKRFLLGAYLLTSLPAWGVLPNTATPAEEAMCEARGMPRGQGYQGHYCDGLRFINRAYSAMGNKQEMQYYLSVAIDNFNYELNRAVVDKVRQGDFHVGKARALKLMGRKAEAGAEFMKALNAKSNSPDVYQALADHFHETGNKEKALEMATEGLKRSPNSKGLKRRYTEFGGKLPYPGAMDMNTPDSEIEDEVASQAKLEAAPAETTSQASVPAKLTAPTGPTPSIETPEIGSKTNPYCRFCPD